MESVDFDSDRPRCSGVGGDFKVVIGGAVLSDVGVAEDSSFDAARAKWKSRSRIGRGVL